MSAAELLSIVDYWIVEAGAIASLLLGIVCGWVFVWGMGRG